MVGWAIGFMAGLGAFTGPVRWLVGRDLTHADEVFLAGKDQGIGRYFRFTTDHKVVGIQYLVLTMVMLGAGGTMAMLIRTDLISPNSGFLGPQTYNSLVGLHGLTMILATIIMVTGPFGNFVVPLMIGARDMAFPKLNALSFWMLAAGGLVFYASVFFNPPECGWTCYVPLASKDYLPNGGVVQNFGSVQEILFLEVSLTENWLIFVTRGGKTWPSWQLIGAILGVDALATIFCAFGWLSGGVPHATHPADHWHQRQDGWTDIVTIVVIWGYSIGVTIVIAIVYYLLNQIAWLDDLGRKNRSHKDPAIENMIAALSKLAIEHGTDKHGTERYILATKAAEEEEDD